MQSDFESLSKAALFHECTGTNALCIEDAKTPIPGSGEVRIKVEAFALNRADLLLLDDLHYSRPTFPSRIASEASGYVEAVGKGVNQYRVGDKVTTVPFHTRSSDRHGVAGEYAVVPERYLAPWPANLSAEQACSIWMQYLTAYFALQDIGRVQPGDTVLIAAAASSAGLGMIQLALSDGVEVVATIRSPEKAAMLYKMGVQHVLVTDGSEDLSEKLIELTHGVGVKLAIDPIGGPFIHQYVNAMAMGGAIILYGVLSGEATVLPLMEMLRSASVLHPYSVFNFVSDPRLLNRGVQYILDKIQNGEIGPHIDRVFCFDETCKAFQYMESNVQSGKIVVRI